MMNSSAETTFSPLLTPWSDYELLDSGDGMKRERWGDMILVRPEAAAFWPRKNPKAWDQWNGYFQPSSEKNNLRSSGQWTWKTPLPNPWKVSYHDLEFLLRPTSSKQVGIFPEQAGNWDWCTQKIISAGRPIKLLNLFGYTGAASIAAAAAGASVCHVDSSKAMVSWCSDNAKINFCDKGKETAIRFIVDDCNKFIAREARRKNSYDAIILDPPTFGRGGSSSIWKLEDHLLSLLQQCQQLLSNDPLFLMISTYSPMLHLEGLNELLQEAFNNHHNNLISIVPLGLQGSQDQQILSCGATGRWELV